MTFLRRAFAIVALALLAAAPARAFETRATAAWVYDMSTQTVLLDKNADVALPPASMSKLMTINMLFEALRDGRVTLDTTFAVSSRAKAMGGSTMFLNEMDRPTVHDLIRGMIINSGNDACVVVAEGLAGTEDAFAALMTERAKALGMTNSTFRNSSGWPDPDHRMSMRDLGILAKRLISEFPEYYPIFSETEFNYQDRAPANASNRNPLLRISAADWQADGLKTGHTSEAGYGLVGSAVMGDRRVIFVITGLASDTDRAQESEAIVNWAFRQFTQKTIAKAGTRLAEAPVWMGAADTVGLVPAEDISLLVPAQVQEGVTAEVIYTGPVTAPVTAGQQLGELIVHVPDLPDARVPLVAEADVAAGGFTKRLTTAAQVLMRRYLDSRSGDPAPAS
ncbi:D-alanyl-D-alanine carboxypeptidase [Rhodobacteraceae bacterium HSP-20]|uniref:serine-type D-Ala-D-Ala carboxypeptidase n=1 Tax=Paragemmobacter amnigenus TaxID=2852097 RepID=A0ABS6J6D7_9RHOB|nr:D-alanyl-D-alanine carboxypeptidase family protein [Rhodobacter amnigenus]MBU9699313.1 D-alanyl-D-alanine carboxypeptidase [Rhodobacter amnigenus]MBV4390540.1 D-alanyl-D-alanine carboxypeptidase [Rhodobacter amnigenus]